MIEGHPTITTIVLDDVQTRASSELVLKAVRCDRIPHESLFRETALGAVPGDPVWDAPSEGMQ